MKHFVTKLLTVCALIAFFGSVQAQVFYTQLFDNPGLPTGWTTADPSGNNVLWARCTNVDTDCHADLGYDLFAGTDKANGFMVLDSDGAGELGDTHQSQLTTAAINCSDKSEVFAIFEHQIGVYDYDADENAQLFVSNNGTTWTAFQLFTDITGAGGTRFSENPIISSIDISSVAANQATVYLRWEWIGNYEYWWTLDKVQMSTEDMTPIPPAHNLAVTDFYYPVSSYATPESQIGTDTFEFTAYISNLGTATQTNVRVYAYVLQYNEMGQFQGFAHVDSIVVPALAPGVVDSAITIENLYAPELPLGLYAVGYEVFADSLDGDDEDNFDGDFFEVTDFLFAKENGPEVGYRPASGGDWGVGNYYRMGPGSELFKAVIAEFCYAVNAPLLAGDVNIDLTLFRIHDTVDVFFDNFEEDGSSMTVVGSGAFEAPDDAESYDLHESILYDLNTAEEGVILEPNGRYLLAASYVGANSPVFHAFNDNVSADFVTTLLYANGGWGGNFIGNPNPVMRMYLDLVVTTDEKPLAETALTVFPNPTADVVSLQVKFDEPTDATITIADINGRVVRTENRASMLDETVTYQMPQLASGTYLARIATAKGTRTLKFVVQK